MSIDSFARNLAAAALALAGGGGGTPAGSNGDLQINSSGVFGALTPGANIAAALAIALNTAGGLVGYSALGSAAFASTSAFDAAGAAATLLGSGNTWTGANAFNAGITLSGNISAASWGLTGLKLIGGGSTLTDTSAAGTVASGATDVFGGNTIAATNARTLTNYYSLYIKDPIAGTNVTFTNKWSLGLAGSLSVGNNAYVNGTFRAVADLEIYNDATKARAGTVSGRRVLLGPTAIAIPSTASMSWGSHDFGTAEDIYTNRDLYIWRGGPGILEQRNAGAAQLLRVFSTYTDAATNAFGGIGAAVNLDGTAGDASTLYIGSQKAGAPTALTKLAIQVNGTTRLDYGITTASDTWTLGNNTNLRLQFGLLQTGNSIQVYAQNGLFLYPNSYPDTSGGSSFYSGGSGIIRFAGHLTAGTDNLYDIGDTTHRPRTAYVAGTVRVGPSSTAIVNQASAVSIMVSSSTVAASLTAENTGANGSSSGAIATLLQNSGTSAASGTRLGSLGFGGISANSGTTFRIASRISSFASENWVDASAYGSRLEFSTITNGATSAATKLILGNSGILTFGATEANTVPALKPSSAILQAKLGDDSAYTVFDAILRMQGTAPSTASDTGTAGDMRYDSGNIYICTATNTWKRVAIATF